MTINTSLIGNLIGILAPVLICVFVGLAWRLRGWPYDAMFINRLIQLSTPCLVFSSVTRHAEDGSAIGRMVLIAAVSVLCFLIIGVVVLKFMRLSLPVWLAPFTFNNIGNMGVPVCLFAFGERGMTLGISFIVVANISLFTLGPWITHGRPSPWPLLKSPMVYAALATLPYMLGHYGPPRWLANSTQLIGGISVPLMLISLGAALAALHVDNLGKTLTLAALRQGIGFGVGHALAWLFALSAIERSVLILQSSMPVAVYTYFLALQYHREPASVASLILVSTLLSLITLPFLLTYLIG